MSACNRRLLTAIVLAVSLPHFAFADSATPAGSARTHEEDLQSLFIPLDRYMGDPITIGSHFDLISPILVADGFELLDIWDHPHVEYHLDRPEYDVHVGLCENIVTYVEIILRSENVPRVFTTMSENTSNVLGNPKVSFFGDATNQRYMTFEWPNGPNLYKQSIFEDGMNVTLETGSTNNC